MEQKLHDNLKLLPKRIDNDKDVLGIIVGSPGIGKSTIAQQCGFFLDPTLTCKSIKYSYEDYIKYSCELFDNKQSKGKSIIHDESKESLSAVMVMSKRTRNFMNFLYENRQMNMYQFVLSGDFFDIPKSIVMQRSLFMIQVLEEGEFQNGYFHFFNGEDMKRLYIKGKKERNMRASGYTFRGTFPKFYTVDEDEYRKLKRDHIKAERYLESERIKHFNLKDIFEFCYEKNPEVDMHEFARVFDCDPSSVYRYKKALNTADGISNIDGGEDG